MARFGFIIGGLAMLAVVILPRPVCAQPLTHQTVFANPITAQIKAVEENAPARRAGGDTNKLNDAVAERKRDLLRALDKWRGQPF